MGSGESSPSSAARSASPIAEASRDASSDETETPSRCGWRRARWSASETWMFPSPASVRWSINASLSERRVFLRASRSEEHTSELQSRFDLVCRLLLEKKKGENKCDVEI